MGGFFSSYLKINVAKTTLGIVYQHGNSYQKVIINAGSNPYTVKEKVNYSKYKAYGEWYYYDGDFKALHQILNNFDPKTSKVSDLTSELKVRCDMKEYETVWAKIKKWAKYAANAVNLPMIIGGGLMLLGWTKGSDAT